MQFTILSVVMLLLCACASGTEWSNPDVSSEQLERDTASCTRQVVRRGSGTTFRENVIDPACMEALGYTRQ